MDARQSTAAHVRAVSSPSRRLIAAGIKRGSGPLAVQVLSDADRAAHDAASYVRPLKAAA
ncbi:hypothetical protein GLX30_30320 [Streptomyces sp. Tu 2975]|uniref:hypothetical protein n=1 Tax=Streptomyces sp. Tu 2975 TaxID=2676871 RepID=UPI00135C339C|nr:hypothetical protein [Streptomyces sp. Tu 2975]QIP87610.1 hypothetical protein GLX30_30320 [Streptomyces sp. Tu 2975]